MKDMIKELDRVNKAIEDAEKKRSDLLQNKVMNRENAAKVNELHVAITIGKKYRDRLKSRCL